VRAAADSTGSSAGGDASSAAATAAAPAPRVAAAAPVPRLPKTAPNGLPLVRWRDMAAPRILKVANTVVAVPPVYRSSFPVESALKDDVALPISERVMRAIHRRLISKWYSSDQLALIPSGTVCRAPPVTTFDRCNVMICHDQETELVNALTDTAQPLPPASSYHLAQVFLELPVSLPTRAPDSPVVVAAGKGGSGGVTAPGSSGVGRELELDKQYHFSYAWMPGACAGGVGEYRGANTRQW
jgi:hypothetical protein